MTSKQANQIFLGAERSMTKEYWKDAEEVSLRFGRGETASFVGELRTTHGGLIVASGLWVAALDDETDEWIWMLIQGVIGEVAKAWASYDPGDYYVARRAARPLTWASGYHLEMTTFSREDADD